MKPTSLLKDASLLLLMTTSALCGGVVINQFRDTPLPLIYQSKEARLNEVVRDIRAAACPVGASAPEDGPISLAEFQGFVSNKKGIVLDARPEIFHRLGHVPNALSLPRDDFENAYNRLGPLLAHRDQRLAVYCSGASCEDSELVRDTLHKLGYTHVLIFKGGWDEWTEAGLPEEN